MQAIPWIVILGLGVFTILDLVRVGAVLCSFVRLTRAPWIRCVRLVIVPLSCAALVVPLPLTGPVASAPGSSCRSPGQLTKRTVP
jgi:hypothetical protein